MTFAARQQELRRHLLWGPRRGAKRKQRLAELQALVRAELQREVAAATQPPPPVVPPTPVTRARPYYWLDRDDEDDTP